METLTKEQAVAAMKEGKKVQHRWFSSSEWMAIDGAGFLFEDGVRCSYLEFWGNRQDKSWQTGWTILKEPTPNTV